MILYIKLYISKGRRTFNKKDQRDLKKHMRNVKE